MAITINGTNTVANPGITGADTDTGLSFGTNEVSINTDGTERFRVGSAGQFGIGGATYGSSGQVLTSQGSGSAPQWATPAAGASEFFDVAVGTGTSGIQWSSIPSDVNRIVMAYYDVSGSSTGYFEVQIGTGGTLQTSGYNFFDGYVGNSSGGSKRTNQSSWYTTMSSNTGNEYSGIITIQSVDETNSWWVIDWVNYDDVNAGNTIARVTGSKGFNGRLDIVRFGPTLGNFDSGAVSINYFT